MLDDKIILIVEDNCYIALDFALAIEGLNGRSIGPAGTIGEALDLLSQAGPIDGAILAARILDDDPGTVMMALASRNIPAVVHSEAGVDTARVEGFPEVQLVAQPIAPQAVIDRLVSEIGEAQLPSA